jgi:hypothetical protein
MEQIKAPFAGEMLDFLKSLLFGLSSSSTGRDFSTECVEGGYFEYVPRNVHLASRLADVSSLTRCYSVTGTIIHCVKVIASQLRPAFSEGGMRERWRIGGVS